MVATGETALRTPATNVVGVALFWGALAGALDTLLFQDTQFAGPLVALRYAASAALLQALLGVPLALGVWCGAEWARHRSRVGEGLPRIAAATSAAALPVALRVLLWANDAYMGRSPALSARGLLLAGCVFGATALAAAGLAAWLARRARPRGRRLAAAGWLLAAGALAIVAPAALGGPGAGPGAKGVVLISIDSVRKDTWDRYMAEHASPELRRFASESRRFERAHTTWSHSLASHASMLTGLYPFEHGAVLERSPEHGTLGSALAPNVVLLTEQLALAGYQTSAFIANSWLGPPWGLEAGFETFVNGARAGRIGSWTPMLLASATLPGAYLRVLFGQFAPRGHTNTRLFSDWIARRDRSRPFFSFLHYIEMHVPHDPPAAAASAIARGRFAGLGGREAMRRVEAGEIPAADLPELIEHLHDLAVAMLSEVDGFLVPALEALRDEDLLDRTLVILTSDHGDNLYEKADSYSHSHVYQTIAHVPLLLHVPGDSQGSRSSELASVVDFAPTIYAFTGVAEPNRLSGVNLLDPSARSAAGERAIFAQGGHPDGGHARAMLTRDYKLIENPNGSRELYRLASDPAERRDLAAAEPERVATLARQLDAVFAAARNDSQPIDVDTLPPDVAEKLRGLGYIE